MSSRKFQPSSIKNKIKREDEARKAKRVKRQDKLQRRLALAKEEANDPALKRVRGTTPQWSPCL
jgi:ribosome production factor 1